MSESIYDHQYTDNKGNTVPFSTYQGKVLLIVNTASKCGYTYQYDGLENLHKKYQAQGFEVIGFPCDQFGGQEPGSDEDIAQFCEMRFNLSFPLSTKVQVNGEQAAPVYKMLKKAAPGILGSTRIKWNFTKFLINQQGQVVKRYATATKPEAIDADIAAMLDA